VTANIQTFIKNGISPIVFRKIYQGFKRNYLYKCWIKRLFANIYFYIKCFYDNLLVSKKTTFCVSLFVLKNYHKKIRLSVFEL